MDEKGALRAEMIGGLGWKLRLTLLGILAERVARAFWPVWTILLFAGTALAFGVQDHLDRGPLLAAVGGTALALVVALVLGLRRFRLPRKIEALDRIDRRLPGRPLAALGDALALGGRDPATAGVWNAHILRMTERARRARPVAPDLRLAARDPYAIRYAALTAFVVALAFGLPGRLGEVAGLVGAPGTAVAAGPAWEGWAEPPAYTGRPSLYLNAITEGTVEVPEGTEITFRLYGGPGLTVGETVSGNPLPEGGPAPSDDPVRAIAFEAVQSGEITVDGSGGRTWQIAVLPDAAPGVEFAGDIGREADGRMTQPFRATDDHAVTAGRAEITLDLAAVDRRYGLAYDPEPQPALILDLPLPFSGSRTDFTEVLVDDLSKHPWANLPVQVSLYVEDGRGQEGQSDPRALVLPGKRFFDPLAAAIAEMRRDLLWNRQTAPDVRGVLRALTHRPEGLFRNERAFLMLRVAMRRLDGALAAGGLSAEVRDELAEALWEIAVLIEDGGLADALERMQRAQERLSEAIRNGASPEEIEELMNELREATQDYIRMLAERGQQMDDGLDTPQDGQQQGQQITGDQLQQMMDEIQRLMEEGRMAEAQELLEQLQRMLENLQVTQGQGGEPMQGGPGQQAMRDLQDMLRQQQGLSDEAFRDLQERFGQQQGQQGQQGQPGQPGQPGQQGEGQEGDQQGQPGQPGEGGSLADRQRALRDLLNQQLGGLPGQGEAGDEARRQLGDASRAMRDAERALRDGDLPGAIDEQAEAIERLREGMRSLGEALAQEQGGQPGQQGMAQGEPGSEVPRDPLGRETGQGGRTGTEEQMLGQADIQRRAQELLDEIRRRSAERERPDLELDYLDRLLDRF